MHPLFAGIAVMIVAIVVPVLFLCKLDYQCTFEVLTMTYTLVHMATTFAVTVIVATFSQRPFFQVPVSDFQRPVFQNVTQDEIRDNVLMRFVLDEKDEIRFKIRILDEMKKALNHHVNPNINTTRQVADHIECLKDKNSQLDQNIVSLTYRNRQLFQKLLKSNSIRMWCRLKLRDTFVVIPKPQMETAWQLAIASQGGVKAFLNALHNHRGTREQCCAERASPG
jgi:hypothetical protein